MVDTTQPAPGFAPLPVGSRDLLPDACRRREQLVATLMATFDRWGYEPVQTPAVEYFEVLGRGLAPSERERCVRFIEAGTGSLVSLRSDVTPQIARMVAQRGAHRVGEGKCLRLRYAADVIRLPRARHDHPEVHQLGVELVGDGHVTADAELLLMCHEALTAVGLQSVQFDLTHAGIGRSLFGQLCLASHHEAALRRSIERKDVTSVDRFLREHEVAGTLASALRSICDLYGSPAIIPTALERLPAATHPALHALAETLQAVAAQDPRCHAKVSVDLGELRGYDYYTGMRMRVWAEGVPGPVVRGGRYDSLVSRYGHACPASGFAIDLDSLDAACRHDQATPQRPSAVMVAIAGDTPQLRMRAQSRAREHRQHGSRAWVQPVTCVEHAQQLADATGVRELHYLAHNDSATLRVVDTGRDVTWVRTGSEES